MSRIKAQAEAEQFSRLIQLIRNDQELNKRVMHLLKLDSYQRRLVLNRWLEELRRISAPDSLRHALSHLFDDRVSDKVLTLICNHKYEMY
jgi:hypothetical protein